LHWYQQAKACVNKLDKRDKKGESISGFSWQDTNGLWAQTHKKQRYVRERWARWRAQKRTGETKKSNAGT
jgi:hypothetical protein